MTEKLYFSIGEVASMLKVNASLIRFWEKEFPQIKPVKNKKGNRLFTSADIEILRTIHHLVKEKGFTLQGARDYMSKNRAGIKKENEIRSRLDEIKKTLIDLRDRL